MGLIIKNDKFDIKAEIEESNPVKAAREARAQTETPAQWKSDEVPS